jgi:hypothetical protein
VSASRQTLRLSAWSTIDGAVMIPKRGRGGSQLWKINTLLSRSRRRATW